MATGGMGDVLTGMITSFLAQGYTSTEAAILAVFFHGKAGDELVKEKKMALIPASHIIKKLPEVIGSFSNFY
jgi:NAD(P)H-hydrate epimerase